MLKSKNKNLHSCEVQDWCQEVHSVSKIKGIGTVKILRQTGKSTGNSYYTTASGWKRHIAEACRRGSCCNAGLLQHNVNDYQRNCSRWKKRHPTVLSYSLASSTYPVAPGSRLPEGRFEHEPEGQGSIAVNLSKVECLLAKV